MVKYSVVLPLRDAPHDRIFATKSIPSIIKLQPDELVIGVDAPMSESFSKFIHELCEKESFENLKIVQVDNNIQKWNFALAHVMWQCCKEAKNDKILITDVDVVLKPAVLKGYELVGKDNNGFVCLAHQIVIKNPLHIIKHLVIRIRLRIVPPGLTGLFWVYRPYFFENIDLEGYKQIYNGTDTYIAVTVQKHKYKVVGLRDVGGKCYEAENYEYPWRQFQAGIWIYANRNISNYEDNNIKSLSSSPKKHFIVRQLDRLRKRHSIVAVLVRVVLYQQLWILRGWLWARKNEKHEVVQAVYGKTANDIVFAGAEYIKSIRDWSKCGMTSTGFNESENQNK